MTFRFRQFAVEDDRSTLRVGTDAVLLGAWTRPDQARFILDIGTGCGLIALMLAQRSRARIDAIDPDENSAIQAKSNFTTSPWSGQLSAICTTLRDFIPDCPVLYDLIVTNPPFFTDSLKSPDPRKNLAKHDTGLSIKDLILYSKSLLSDHGALCLILPSGRIDRFAAMAGESGFFLHRRLQVRPKEGKSANRVLAEFRLTPAAEPEEEELVIRDTDGRFTSSYERLTGAYYLPPR